MCNTDEGTELERRWVKARRPHRCYACRRTITPGDLYHRTAQVFDGKPSAFKHCATCWAICEELWNAGAESVQWDLNCGERWEDNFGDIPEPVAALAFETREEAQARASRVIQHEALAAMKPTDRCRLCGHQRQMHRPSITRPERVCVEGLIRATYCGCNRFRPRRAKERTR